MANSLLRRAALSVVALSTVLMATVAQAQDESLAKRVDLFLRDANILQATQALTLQTGIQFVIEPGASDAKLINLSLTDKTAEEAIEYICTAAGAYAERDPNGVFIIRFGSKTAPKPVVDPPIRVPKIIQKIKVMRGDPETIYQLVTSEMVADPYEGFRSIDRFRNQATQPAEMYRTPPVTLNVFGSGGQVMTGDATMPAVQPAEATSNGVRLPGEGANQFGGPGGGGGFGGGQFGGGGQPGGGGGFGGGGFGGGGQPGGGGGFGGGQNGGGVTGLTGGTGFVPEGIDRIVYDPTDNSFIVQGTEEAIRELERVIEQFDVAPKQVVIKVEFVTTSESVDRSFGMDWFYSRNGIFAGNRPGSFARNSDPIFLNYATGNIETRLRTLLTDGWGRTVQAPLLRTMNNQPAFVANQLTTWFVRNTISNGPGGIVITPSYQQIPIVTSLVVRPRINNDGTITMYLSPTVSDIGQIRRTGDGEELPPDFLSQTLSVPVRVRDGETIALAGLTRKNNQSSSSRFPILSELPIIGQLFRTRSRNEGTSELIIFVTPSVVDEDDLGLGGGP